MRLIITIVILFIQSNLTVHAQNKQHIRGAVFNEEGQPIPSASITTPQGSTITDSLGIFNLQQMASGKHRLQISSKGYTSFSQSIMLPFSNPDSIVNIYLQPSYQSLEDVVISGTMRAVNKLQSPVPVDVYCAPFFKANPTPSIFEALQQVNGVRPQLNCNICNTGDIHINGLEGPYTMVLIDGMPIVSGLSTVYGLTGIPMALVERVEIVKGPASTLYGSEAVGGLINIITKSPETAPDIHIDAMATHWGDVNIDLGKKWRVGKKTTALLGVNYFNYQQPKDNNHDGFTDVTLQHRVALFNKIEFARKQQRIFTLAGRLMYEDRWGGEMHYQPKFRGGDSVYGESINTKRWELTSTYQIPSKEHLILQMSANGHYQQSAYGTTIYNAKQIIGFTQLSYSKQWHPKHYLLLGAALRYTYYDDNTVATSHANGVDNQSSKTVLPGLFAQNEFEINKQNTLLVGMRYDYNSIHGSIFSPRINYKWQSPNAKNIVRISAGNGYRVANIFTEDHAALTGARTVEFAQELQPEKSWNSNLNYIKRLAFNNGIKATLDLTAFYTYFTNKIIPDYTTDVQKIIYSNLDGYAESKGISAQLDISFTSKLQLITGATIMDVSNTENGLKERQLLAERFSAVWNLTYKFKQINASVNYTGNVYGPMPLPLLGALDQRNPYSPWWSLQNIQITKKLGSYWELYGGIKNLLNYTPPSNSIARPFDPFDKAVSFTDDGQVIATPNNPQALTFDPTYVFAPNQGRRGFIGARFKVF